MIVIHSVRHFQSLTLMVKCKQVDIRKVLYFCRFSEEILRHYCCLNSKHHLRHSLCCGLSLQTAPTWGLSSRGCRTSPGPPPGPNAGSRWTSWWLEGEGEHVMLKRHSSNLLLSLSSCCLHAVLILRLCQVWVSDGLCVCVCLTGGG